MLSKGHPRSIRSFVRVVRSERFQQYVCHSCEPAKIQQESERGDPSRFALSAVRGRLQCARRWRSKKSLVKVRELFRKQILADPFLARRVVGVLHAHLFFSFVAAVDWFTIVTLLQEALIKTPQIVASRLL